MKSIVLKSMEIKNFKGIKELKLAFDSKSTTIKGENGTGKSTIFDAFTWLLFNKNSENRTDFDVKTLDSNNEPVHGLELSVEAVLDIDGGTWKLHKSMKENWVKKRGSIEQVFQGNIKSYEINDVPVKESDFTAKISEFVTQDLFVLLTNPLHFSTFLKWQDRRKILMEVLGDIDDLEVINYKTELHPLKGMIDRDLGNGTAEHMPIDDLLKRAQATRKKLADDIKALPVRIDEAANSIKDISFGAVEMDLRRAEKKLESIQDSMRNNTGNTEEKIRLRGEILNTKQAIQNLEQESALALYQKKQTYVEQLTISGAELNKLESELNNLEKSIYHKSSELARTEESLKKLRQDYEVIYKQRLVIPDDIVECPTCHRAFEDAEVKAEHLKASFNTDRATRLENLQKEGSTLSNKLKPMQDELSSLKEARETLSNNIASLKDERRGIEAQRAAVVAPDHKTTPEYQKLTEKLAALEEALYNNDKDTAIKSLKEEEYKIKMEISNLNSQLAYKDQNERQKERIEELQEELKDKVQKHAEQESVEYLCELFKKTKAELLESSINNRFKYVSFKLFNPQINGGMTDTCEALINGVPFADANKASKYNAGLDIINTLSNHYQVIAPIFLDNRESVNRIIETQSQIINLIVSDDKSLKVEV